LPFGQGISGILFRQGFSIGVEADQDLPGLLHVYFGGFPMFRQNGIRLGRAAQSFEQRFGHAVDAALDPAGHDHIAVVENIDP